MNKGQILLPALAAYWGLLVFFFAMVGLGTRQLTQVRMDMAAQAAALSVARAEAQVLNRRATHNLAVNTLVPVSYSGMGAMQRAARDPFWFWLKTEQAWLPWKAYAARLRGQCISVGSRVARLNGADPGKLYYPLLGDFKLQPKPLGVILFKGIHPVGYEEFDEAYYARQWGGEKRNAQPTHAVHWLAAKENIRSVGKAGVYLDLQDKAVLHNGGFPRLNEEWGWGGVGVQSFYPQFNARLQTPSRGMKKVLEKLHEAAAG